MPILNEADERFKIRRKHEGKSNHPISNNRIAARVLASTSDPNSRVLKKKINAAAKAERELLAWMRRMMERLVVREVK